jgi:hypothetical protein
MAAGTPGAELTPSCGPLLLSWCPRVLGELGAAEQGHSSATHTRLPAAELITARDHCSGGVGQLYRTTHVVQGA